MFPFDPLDFLLNCDCSIGHAAGGGAGLPAVLLLLGFAAVLLRRRSGR